MNQRSATPRALRSRVDRRPRTAQEWTAFAALPAEARTAVYLRSIRAMLRFFTVLTILGIVVGVVLAILGIHAIDQSNTPAPTGLGG